MATGAFEEIIADFGFLENWEDRYRYIIDLGRQMEALPEPLRTPSNKVSGCASQVWIRSEIKEGQFQFQGASDATIVQGLIAVLTALYNSVPIEEVTSINAAEEMKRLNLDDHLSSQRSNGLASMIARLRGDAASYMASKS